MSVMWLNRYSVKVITIYAICFFGREITASQTSNKKCEEYAGILKHIPAPNTTKDDGIYAAPRQLPFTALIGYGKGILAYWLCGGILISPRYVLTAAHCSEDKRIGPARMVWLGDLELGTMEDEATTNIVDIDERIVHPNYKDGFKHHDIALFRLQLDMAPTLYIRPACLGAAVSDLIFSPGWGANGDAFLGSMKLKIGSAKLASCQEVYSNHHLLPDGINNGLCAVAVSPNQNMCQSDTGGGLITTMKVDDYEMYSVIGINAISENCTSKPVFYTKVDLNIDWIESVVWSSDESP